MSKKIEQENPVSIKLLHTLSFLDPDHLPSSIIEAALQPESENHIVQLAPLLNFGLLSRLGSSNYRLHRLVGMWMRVKMSSEVKHEFINHTVVLMEKCFPPDSYENVTKYNEILPHAVSIIDHIVSDGFKFGSTPSWKLQYSVVDFLDRIGQLHLGKKHAQLILGQEEVFEPDEYNRYISRARSGGIFHSMAQYASAINEYQHALNGLESAFGKGRPETFCAVHNMAIVFQSEGDYDKALEWYRHALDGSEKALGRDHPSTLLAVHNMAKLFENKGEYDKALEWYQRALDGQEKDMGSGHPRALLTVHNMATVFQSKRDYDKALEWYQRVLDFEEKTSVKGHLKTLTTVHDMAIVFGGKGYYDKALELRTRWSAEGP